MPLISHDADEVNSTSQDAMSAIEHEASNRIMRKAHWVRCRVRGRIGIVPMSPVTKMLVEWL